MKTNALREARPHTHLRTASTLLRAVLARLQAATTRPRVADAKNLAATTRPCPATAKWQRLNGFQCTAIRFHAATVSNLESSEVSLKCRQSGSRTATSYEGLPRDDVVAKIKPDTLDNLWDPFIRRDGHIGSCANT